MNCGGMNLKIGLKNIKAIYGSKEVNLEDINFTFNNPNEIEITMTNPNEPPMIKLNGQVIDGIIGLDYKYDTSDAESNGQHNFSIQYFDKETSTIRTAVVHKMLEG